MFEGKYFQDRLNKIEKVKQEVENSLDKYQNNENIRIKLERAKDFLNHEANVIKTNADATKADYMAKDTIRKNNERVLNTAFQKRFRGMAINKPNIFEK